MQISSNMTPDNEPSRIETHGAGMGPPTPDVVERRAREIAETEGRSPEQFTEEDRVRATQELSDLNLDLLSDEPRSNGVATGNPADMAVEAGHQVPDMEPRDEQEIMEAEVKEGVKEAEHEQILEGNRRDAEEAL